MVKLVLLAWFLFACIYVYRVEGSRPYPHQRHHRPQDRILTVLDCSAANLYVKAKQGIYCKKQINAKTSVDVWVSKVGTIAEAINVIPVNNGLHWTIHLDAATYREKIYIPQGKNHITLQGQGRDKSIIIYNDNANSAGGTYQSATFAVDADYFVARDITFQNDAVKAKPGDVGKQAVALRVGGDMAAFYNCAMISAQDTIYDVTGRHYYENCYIAGNVDFICGAGRSLFKSCELHSTATSVGAITAQKRSTGDTAPSGFSFVDCTITGTGQQVLLGRSWGDRALVVFANTYIPSIVDPKGWDTMSNTAHNKDTVTFAEYKTHGPGSYEKHKKQRVKWATQLNDQTAKQYLTKDFIDGSKWL